MLPEILLETRDGWVTIEQCGCCTVDRSMENYTQLAIFYILKRDGNLNFVPKKSPQNDAVLRAQIDC